MFLVVIINSVVCVVGVIVGLFFAGGSIISIANMTVPWRGGLLVAAIGVPVAFVISGVGAWLAYTQDATLVVVGLLALPWLYAVVFVLAMWLAFKQ